MKWKIFKYSPLFLLLISLASPLLAQRSATYESLVQQSDIPNVYSSALPLPSPDSSALLLYTFRTDYDFLPFRRIQNGDFPEEAEFFATLRLNVEIRQGNRSVTRNSWTDTIWTDTYERTRSRTDHLGGALGFHLEPGTYDLSAEISTDNSSGTSLSQRSGRNRSSRPSPFNQNFEVPDFSTLEEAQFLLIESVTESENQRHLKLLNYGPSSLYGQDYQLMVLLPGNSENAGNEPYQIQIHDIRHENEEQDPLFEQEIDRDELLYTDGFSHNTENNQHELIFSATEDGYPLFIAEIPNSQFPNSRFQLTVTTGGEAEPLVEQVIESRWPDIPVSLLHLDVALDMLRFIVDDDELRQMKRGSNAEKEEKFRQFWSERDPTPESEFNELMNEYYTRIDEAYNNYTTPETPGYASDQGQAYILYGEPRQKERIFPTDGPTREVWTYANRTLVFEATTGFGDFRLIEQR